MSDSLVFPGKTRTEQRAVSVMQREGLVQLVGPRLYVRTDVQDVAAVVRGNWARIISTLYPRALVSHRTALEFNPTPDGDVFLTAKTNRVVEYPGLRLRFARGPDPLPDDMRFLGARASSLPRAFLENLSTSRSAVPRSVARDYLEGRLEQILRDAGEPGLNEMRDRAKQIAEQLGWQRELERLEQIVGALLGTRDGSGVTSRTAVARAAGEPYDARCLERLALLAAELRGRVYSKHAELRGFGAHFANKAFFEAYFSNYIEGTIFELEEAARIVFEHEIPASRPKDAHDIASTYRIVADPDEMRRTVVNFEQLREVLLSRHATLMHERPEVEPGRFKTSINRAGNTVFVHPDYVVGTLRRGFEILLELPTGFPRATFVMFLISDVHPFNDGNGRIARIMMNAELVSSSNVTIIIPTNYRDSYLDTLRALTRQHRPGPVVDMLLRAQAFSDLDFTDYPAIAKHLRQHNWFEEPGPLRLIR